MGMLRVYTCTCSSIRKEFIKNLDEFLQNDFHLKSSFDKTKYNFDQSIWECNGHLIIGFQNTKAFLGHMEFTRGETLSFRFIRFCFAQLHQSMRGQWQKCYGSAFMRYLFIITKCSYY